MGPRSFDPVRLGAAECSAWVAYYRHDWRRMLTASVTMVRVGFGMSWPRTFRAAWLVLRATQSWAPHPDNDPAAAQAYMRRFYTLVARDGSVTFDPARAAELEIEWWRVHRMHQRSRTATEDELTTALAQLYAYTYGTPPEQAREAAALRMTAMGHSDEWVRNGCRLDDPLIAQERDVLVASYRSLLAAVGS